MYVSALPCCFLIDWLVCRSGVSASTAKTASTATFVTAIVFNSVVFAIELVIFTLLRPYFKAVYEPRTYVPRLECANLSLWPRIDSLTFLSQETNTAPITFYVRMAHRSISRRLSRYHISQWSWRLLFRSLPQSHGIHIPTYLVGLVGRPHARRCRENNCFWRFWFGLFHFWECRRGGPGEICRSLDSGLFLYLWVFLSLMLCSVYILPHESLDPL